MDRCDPSSEAALGRYAAPAKAAAAGLPDCRALHGTRRPGLGRVALIGAQLLAAGCSETFVIQPALI